MKIQARLMLLNLLEKIYYNRSSTTLNYMQSQVGHTLNGFDEIYQLVPAHCAGSN